MSILGTILLVLPPVLWVWYHIANRRKVTLAARFPGPPTVPILGNLLIYVGKRPEDILDIMSSYVAIFGNIYRIWISSFEVAFFFNDPKDVEVILSSNTLLKKNKLYDYLVPWLGTGLLISKGNKWHSRRKIITPAFHFKILEQFLDTFEKKGRKMIDQLKEKVMKSDKGTVVDLYPLINTCTLDVICETSMGFELNSQDNQNSSYVSAVVRTSEIATKRFVSAWMRIDFIFQWFYPALKREHDDCIKLMHDFTDSVIKQRREKLLSGSGE